jgi:hypothetical protein
MGRAEVLQGHCQDNEMAGERRRGQAGSMAEISYRRHRFLPVVIQHAVRLYLCFTLSYRDVEDLLAERGLDVSYETVRSWVLEARTSDRATATAAPSSADQPQTTIWFNLVDVTELFEVALRRCSAHHGLGAQPLYRPLESLIP